MANISKIKFKGVEYDIKPLMDSVPTQGSTNAVQSGGVKSALDGLRAEIPTVDPVPTQGSTNAVQSGGVKSALDGLQAEIPTVDSVPTQGSNNAVSSGGVYEQIEGINDGLIDIIGAKPLSGGYQNGYIALNTATINMDNTHSTSDIYKYIVVECNEGDVFYIKGDPATTSTIYSLYAWVQEDRTTKISSVITPAEEYTRIAAPVNAKYLVSNINKNYPYGLMQGEPANIKTSEIAEYLKSYNLFCIAKSSIGYIDANGELHVPTNAKEITSDYIPVSSGEKFALQVWSTPISGSTQSITVAEYDAQKTFLRRVTKTGTASNYYNATHTISNDAVYVRIVARLFDDGFISITKGDFTPAYLPCVKDIATKKTTESFNNAIDGVTQSVTAITGNTVYTDFSDGYIPVNQGTINKDNVKTDASFNHLLVACSAYDNFYVTGVGGENTIRSLYTFIDASGTKLKTGNNQTDGATISIIAPENSAYLIINANINYAHMLIKNNPIVNRVQTLENNANSNIGLSNVLLRPAKPRCMLHRGDMTQAPENSIPAFTIAGQNGAWCIETDVQETTDGYFVLSHDNDVARMTDGTGNITEMTYAQTQECTIDTGNNIEQYPNLKMPLLEDYLKICKRYGCIPLVEIKHVTHYDKLVETIAKSGMSGSVLYTFYYDAQQVATMRALTSAPIVFIGALSTDVDDLISKASGVLDAWLSLDYRTVTNSVLETAHAINMPVGVWTISNKTQGITYFDMGVDYVCGNIYDINT